MKKLKRGVFRKSSGGEFAHMPTSVDRELFAEDEVDGFEEEEDEEDATSPLVMSHIQVRALPFLWPVLRVAESWVC